MATEALIEVYWRPGCGFCRRLFRALDVAGIGYSLRNIWEDDEARLYVRAHNREMEIVPTVRIGGRTLTNPDPAEVIALAHQGASG